MVVNAGGLVLTNNHVIEDSTKITATVVSTGKTYPARVVGYDQSGRVVADVRVDIDLCMTRRCCSWRSTTLPDLP